jgi:hypothetical protein
MSNKGIDVNISYRYGTSQRLADYVHDAPACVR